MSERHYGDYVFRSYTKRRLKNYFMNGILAVCTLLALVPLVGILSYIFVKGAAGLNLDFLRSLPKPVGEPGGGMANGLLGTATLICLASCLGIPWGMLIGLYLNEFGRGKRAAGLRLGIDVLASIPSIVIGLFVYAIIVVPMHRFSAIAGGVALGLLMVPTVARVTEEILRLVPVAVREGGLALGLPRWKVVLFLVLRSNLGAITTGVMLAIARVAGETAPLLFTALNNRFWQQGLDQPISSLPVQIYNYAISPFDDWHRQAWAGALVLVVFVFAVNLSTRALLSARGVREIA